MKRPEIVAELSGNHDGSLKRALELMDLAVSCGADAVKIQTYTEDSLTLDSHRPEFMLNDGLWAGQSLYELYRRAKTPREWMRPMFEHAREHGIALFSSPFSPEDVAALEDAGCPRYKIASYELCYLELISCCAATGKPMVISTGMGTEEEIDQAVAAAREGGCQDLTLLHCESSYPADPRTFNLLTIPYFRERYGCKTGLSNHALGDTLDIAAAALGADMIEKHFTDSRASGSVDAAFSMEPDDLRRLREDTEVAAVSLGKSGVVLRDQDWHGRALRRSVYITANLRRGDVLRREHLAVVRPAAGLPPEKMPRCLGRRLRTDVTAPLPLSEDLLED